MKAEEKIILDTDPSVVEWKTNIEGWVGKDGRFYGKDKRFTSKVNYISKDPSKRHAPKCIVTIKGEDYGIYFDLIHKIEKAVSQNTSQLQLF